jgi:type IV secretory pathway VirB9-like protein
VLGANGEAGLVNYRVRGQYYVVDRLFRAAELRIGERRQEIVRITRTGPIMPGAVNTGR